MSSSDPVERFVRDVLPTIPGGFQRVTDATGHLELIAAAAADRGLTTQIMGDTRYFYDGHRPVGGMTKWMPSLVSGQAITVCHSKALMKQMLQAAGVPTPDGITVEPNDLGTALAHLRSAGRPQVLKPVTGKGGTGITCGITSDEELRVAWTAAGLEADMPRVLEDHVDGVDIRAFVVGRRLVAAATRLQAHVVGDGRRTIAELVEAKQALRDQNILLSRKGAIVIDIALLTRKGRSLSDVPGRDEVVVVNSKANQHVGAENVDVTDLVHPDLAQLAIDATRAVPGLGLAGVDLMTPSIDSGRAAVVLELNIGANIRVHHTPAYGVPRDVAGAIVDEMIATARHP